MRPNITITVPEPFLPVDEFCRRHGMADKTVRDMIKDGRLPVRSKSLNMKSGKVFINMLALTVEAAASCNISLEAK
ncbi:regulator [Morganella morganii]|uniref:regulatory phage cox family protein n=1 Tax=Morganella morganii TaxID=582 RepID=UPI001BD9A791|nr:regulatory phage cox family protein [Morganella morganii]EJK8623010.1 regulator [Morganella morganii]EKW5727747.1 regulator [Morganella morganii]MBT0503471.1 regulator [Morganella morganii subsp. morganii]MDW7786555.1 regulator [Morganella morganii]QWM11947.1 regulator [Morganella morganii subsp. morganii]